ncbi:MAG: hypothetical protein KDB35_12035 [Acidimicrobiales bacterium]|nr:hypothetical protein [Acidimicrobiales bacterium]
MSRRVGPNLSTPRRSAARLLAAGLVATALAAGAACSSDTTATATGAGPTQDTSGGQDTAVQTILPETTTTTMNLGKTGVPLPGDAGTVGAPGKLTQLFPEDSLGASRVVLPNVPAESMDFYARYAAVPQDGMPAPGSPMDWSNRSAIDVIVADDVPLDTVFGGLDGNRGEATVQGEQVQTANFTFDGMQINGVAFRSGSRTVIVLGRAVDIATAVQVADTVTLVVP